MIQSVINNTFIQNIIIGLLATVFVGLLSYFKSTIENKIIERKYPVQGEYITEFIDEEDGEDVRNVASATLKQSGRKIEGKTVTPSTERSWELSGHLLDDGYLNGTYRAENPHDSGVGNFFLHIKPNGNMHGLWSGYDEINQKVNSGRYIFKKKNKNVRIRPIREKDISTVNALINNELGRDYLNPELLQQSISKEKNSFTLVAVNTDRLTDKKLNMSTIINQINKSIKDKYGLIEGSDETKVVGSSIGMVISPDELATYLNMTEDQIPKIFKNAKKIGVIRTVAVHREHREEGIGTRLIKQCIDCCIKQGAEILCAVGWKVDGSANIDGILKKEGFNKIDELPEHWREESIEREYQCPDCGSPPCTCTGILYARYDFPTQR